MTLTWEWALGVLLSGLVGGGTVAAVGYRALKDRLKEDFGQVFAERGDIKHLADKADAWGSLTTSVSARVDECRDQLVQIRATLQHRIEHGATQDRRLDGHEAQIDRIMESLTRTVTILDRIERRMEANGR